MQLRSESFLVRVIEKGCPFYDLSLTSLCIHSAAASTRRDKVLQLFRAQCWC